MPAFKPAYVLYAEKFFKEPAEDVTRVKVAEAVKVGHSWGLDFWNPKDVPSTRAERDKLRKLIGSRGKDIEDL